MASCATPCLELLESRKPFGVQSVPSAAETVEGPICRHERAGQVDDRVNDIGPDEITFTVMRLETLSYPSVGAELRDGI